VFPRQPSENRSTEPFNGGGGNRTRALCPRRTHPLFKRINESWSAVQQSEWHVGLLYDLYTQRDELLNDGSTNLYVAWDPTDCVKIGIAAREPQRRVENMQVGNPRPLLYVGSCPATGKLERFFHRALAAWVFRGEWFSASPEVLSAVCLILSAEDLARDMGTSDDYAEPGDSLEMMLGLYSEIFPKLAA
jgi:hypothetical protein